MEALQAKGITATAAQAAARLANGNINLALQLGAQQSGEAPGKRFLFWMRACHSGSAIKLVEWTNDFAKLGRENQKNFLHYALHFWREFLLLSVQDGQTEGVRLLPDEMTTAQKMLSVINLDQLSQIIEVINNCIEHVERNANPKILFLNAGLNIHQILRPNRAVKKGALSRTIK